MSAVRPGPVTVIVIAGLPCSGKSTIAAQLQQRLNWPLFAKDTIKETLFDTLGWSDRAWSRRVSDASYALLFEWLVQVARTRTNAIVEANFRGEHAPRFAELRKQNGIRLVQIACSADGELLQQRFVQRITGNTRHPGHVDQQAYVELEPQLKAGRDAFRLPEVDVLLEWDTTHASGNVDELMTRLMPQLSRRD